MIKKILKIVVFIFAVASASFLIYFFIGQAPEPQHITWGVDFSQMQAESLNVDWKKMYLAMMEDLGVKNIKLHTQWDWIEGKKDEFYFRDTDWQINQAESHSANIIYVVGLKTGRWPECYMPAWANGLSETEQQDQILGYIQKTVTRYKGSKSIIAWQAENEPLFKFGECPTWYYQDTDFLKKEVALIKSLDPVHPVIISDSGEQSPWIQPANIGDIVGTTMYRKVWVHITDTIGFYFDFPIPPVSYWLKAEMIKMVFGKKVINVELQAEPWAHILFKDVPLKEQEKSMNLQQFKNNVAYAKKSGFDTFYFWGVEWWFWLKDTQNRPEIWNEAKSLFK